jgi:HEAT repeat protein
MLASRDPVLRSNTALLLGLIGDESAVPMLKEAAKQPLPPRASVAQAATVRIQIAEAVARLGDDSSLDALRAGMYSQYHEVRVLAITALGAVGDRSMEVALENMLLRPDVDPVPSGADSRTHALAHRLKAELQLAAAGALARFGNMRGAELAAEHGDSKEPVLRAQAAWVMGWMNDGATWAKLDRLLDDPVPQVRVSAAASVVRRYKASK